MTLVPRVALVNSPDQSLGYAIGIALDELAAMALEEGASAAELRERLDEAIERAGEDDAA
jgi:hypothetical protein